MCKLSTLKPLAGVLAQRRCARAGRHGWSADKAACCGELAGARVGLTAVLGRCAVTLSPQRCLPSILLSAIKKRAGFPCRTVRANAGDLAGLLNAAPH